MEEVLEFDFVKAPTTIIKVIGVGGGGGNAVTYMFNKGIKDVSFMLCNTDNQAMINSPVPVKIQLGRTKTGGLGAGNKPVVARDAAMESYEEVKKSLSDDTKMVFITAGMGGGTGTGAAPVIAKIAKEMDILTVGIVTIPFKFEGDLKINQAIDGVEEMSKNVDALIVINNELLGEIYPDLTFMNGFSKADDTLTTAAKSIAEIITVTGYINLDFADVKTVMKDGGVAIMSTGFGEGENRVLNSMNAALQSPLLNNNDVFSAKKVLFNILCSHTSELMMNETDQINEFMRKFNPEIEVIWGVTFDDTLDKQVKVILLATGFDLEDVPQYHIRKTILTEEEHRINEETRIKREKYKTFYYREKNNAPVRKRGMYTPYVINVDQMDNESLINMLDNTPAFKRDTSFWKNLPTDTNITN